MIRQVCASYRENAVSQGAPLPVSINLSRLDYELCDIFGVVETAVQANNVPRQSLCIEITESALNDQASLMRYYIERFRDAGYQVWMDDFGSGYSSLNVLKDYQFDELKIDMAFLSDFHSRSKEILTSIVHMAKEINIQTLVEGVETEEQYEFLRNIGCEKVQGFLFGRPLPYLQCIRAVQEKGIPIEPPVYRKYYDDLGRLNVLSATPFVSAVDKKAHTTGRDRNSIPLAVLELDGGDVRLLFSNDAFDTTASALDWTMVFGTPYLFKQDAMPLEHLSGHLVRLLEEARSSGNGKMYFVDKDEYYEMQAKRIAEYNILRARKGVYYLTIRDAEEEIRDFLISLDTGYSDSVSADDGNANQVPNSAQVSDGRTASLTPALLWENFLRCGPLKFFWKDKDRRYRGASQSFLDFYGFPSADGILGKTDEEIGWHLHPDPYRDDEWNVIREGIPTQDVPGTCIVRGENRAIATSKMPLYDPSGRICGLMGYFYEAGAGGPEGWKARLPLLDTLTGLLNFRGLRETLLSYRDEYHLRGRDFGCLRIRVENYAEVNRQYGFVFGDLLIRTAANAILTCCGSTAAVGRIEGAEFAALFQFEKQEDLDAMTDNIRKIPSGIHNIGGVPFTPYLSVSASIFSCLNTEKSQNDNLLLCMITEKG